MSNPKASKETANYRDGTENKRCGICTMFKPPDSCTSVAGEISPRKLCDYFKRIASKLYTHERSRHG